jgi:hypothetical protein
VALKYHTVMRWNTGSKITNLQFKVIARNRSQVGDKLLRKLSHYHTK